MLVGLVLNINNSYDQLPGFLNTTTCNVLTKIFPFFHSYVLLICFDIMLKNIQCEDSPGPVHLWS